MIVSIIVKEEEKILKEYYIEEIKEKKFIEELNFIINRIYVEFLHINFKIYINFNDSEYIELNNCLVEKDGKTYVKLPKN